MVLESDDQGATLGGTKRRNNRMARDASQPLKMASEIGESEGFGEDPHHLPSIEN